MLGPLLVPVAHLPLGLPAARADTPACALSRSNLIPAYRWVDWGGSTLDRLAFPGWVDQFRVVPPVVVTIESRIRISAGVVMNQSRASFRRPETHGELTATIPSPAGA